MEKEVVSKVPRVKFYRNLYGISASSVRWRNHNFNELFNDWKTKYIYVSKVEYIEKFDVILIVICGESEYIEAFNNAFSEYGPKLIWSVFDYDDYFEEDFMY